MAKKLSDKRKLTLYRYFVSQIENIVRIPTTLTPTEKLNEIEMNCKAAYAFADEWETARKYAKKTKLFKMNN